MIRVSLEKCREGRFENYFQNIEQHSIPRVKL